MANPTSLITPSRTSDSDIKENIPTGTVSLSNPDFAKTLPFNDSDVSREIRATILKRTEQRRVWFSKAEELDEERGTKLGTLGFLPWDIRQMIIEEVFEDVFYEFICRHHPKNASLETPDSPPRVFVEFASHSPNFQSITCLQDASASTQFEVEHTFLTKTNFDFLNPAALTYFLGRLTTYQQSLLRSIKLQLCTKSDWSDIAVENKTWTKTCSQLPSGLTSVKVSPRVYSMTDWGSFPLDCDEVPPKVLDCLDRLGKRIKRCWAPRAKVGMNCSDNIWYERPAIKQHELVGFTFAEVEDWGKEWLGWWEKSQGVDQTEGPSSSQCDNSHSSQSPKDTSGGGQISQECQWYVD